MLYRVTAVPNPGHDGFNRSGRRFLSATPTYLTEEEMTPEILAETRLVVEVMPDPPGPEQPADTQTDDSAGAVTPELEVEPEEELEALEAVEEQLAPEMAEPVTPADTEPKGK